MAEKNFINVASGAPINVQIQINNARAKVNSDSNLQRIAKFWKRMWYRFHIITIAIIWCVKDKLFKRHNAFTTDQFPKLSRNVAVLSGGTKGIGVEILKKLLNADMHVLIGCRNVLAGDDILMRIRESGITTGKAECLHLDLSSLASVREFTKKILIRKVAIHVLINNAGIMFPPYLLTMDGFESQFQVNYLGHFLLTMLLVPRLASSALENKFGRIVNVSSCAMHAGQLDFSDLQMKKHYSPHKCYANSKLMQVICSNYLDMRLQAQDAKIHSYSVHPGVIETELYQHMTSFRFFKYFFRFFMKTPEQGADGIVYAALSPEIENIGGLLLSNCQQIRHPLLSIDPVIQQKLWQTSLELCSIDNLQISNSMRKEAVTMVEIG